MTLKFAVDSLENVDEGLHSHYEEGEGGKFFLNVEGAVSKKRLDQFRDNNTSLQRKLDGFKGVDMTEYTTLKENALKGTKYTDDDVTTMVDERVKSMKTQFSSDNDNLKGKLGVATSQLETLLVDSDIRRSALAAGVIPEAIDDVVLRAKSVYTVEDGVAVPKDSKGNIIYGKDGDTPKSSTEWVKDLKKNAGHLFIESAGGGSRRQRGKGGTDTSKMSSLQKISAGIAEK